MPFLCPEASHRTFESPAQQSFRTWAADRTSTSPAELEAREADPPHDHQTLLSPWKLHVRFPVSLQKLKQGWRTEKELLLQALSLSQCASRGGQEYAMTAHVAVYSLGNPAKTKDDYS